MKKLLIATMVLLALPTMAVADQPQPVQQEIKNDQAYFTANLQKQPEKDNKQKIGNHFSFFVVNVQINGKLQDFTPADNVKK